MIFCSPKDYSTLTHIVDEYCLICLTVQRIPAKSAT